MKLGVIYLKEFSTLKGKAFYNILLITFLYNAVIIILTYFSKSYIFSSLLKVILIIFNIYQIYYLLKSITIKVRIGEDSIIITASFGIKKIIIPFKDIQSFCVLSGKIKGVKLTGYGNDSFALGKSIIDKIGIVNMFATSNNNIVYIKTTGNIYGVSPEDLNSFTEILKQKGIENNHWDLPQKKIVHLHKDKNFMVLLILASITIGILTVVPFILYLMNKLPYTMPLSFDANFIPVKIGTGKQFAFKQMSYGILNMAILFLMYYASYFYARYDEKSAYKFMYVSFFIALLFLVLQLRILINY